MSVDQIEQVERKYVKMRTNFTPRELTEEERKFLGLSESNTIE